MTLTAADLNAELSAAVEGYPNWTLAHLDMPPLMAMYASGDIRGFVFPGRNDDGFWNGWTWFVLQEGRGCVRPEGDVEPSAEKTVLLLEEFVASLNETKG